MRDIRYKWNEGPNSVGVSNEVSLPQFKVLGHRQRAMEISLTTGTVASNHRVDSLKEVKKLTVIFELGTDLFIWSLLLN